MTQALSLSKGGNISLTKTVPGLTKVHVGLGWDVRSTDGQAFDLDASAFMLNKDGKVRTLADVIFFNQKEAADGSVIHGGDNLTGAGDGDDEVITVDLTKVAADVEKIAFTVTIFEGDTRSQNFGQVSRASIRVVNDTDNAEITRFDLSEDASTNTAMIFGELYRHDGGWKFKAVGQGFDGGLGALGASFGANFS